MFEIPQQECNICKETKPVCEFYRNKGILYSQCKECLKKKKALPINRELRKVINKEYLRRVRM